MNVRYAALPRDGETLREFGGWMARRTALDPAYISHGEIQTGLSLDGITWRPDLAAAAGQETTELSSPHSPREAFQALDRDNVRVAGAVVLWVDEKPTAYAVLEDLVVDPAVRAAGVATGLVAFIEGLAQRRGAAWLFLESGIRNDSAHHFFERRGFSPISKVFAKRLPR